MIWRASAEDLPELFEMAGRFVRSIGDDYDPESLLGYLQNVMGAGIIIRSRGGMIGGVLTPMPWDANRLMAPELFWWAEDGRGMSLLRAFEGWAESHGVARRDVVLSTHGPEGRADKILARRGYRTAERAFRRAN